MWEFWGDSGLDPDELTKSTATALLILINIPVLGRGVIYFHKIMPCVKQTISRKYLPK